MIYRTDIDGLRALAVFSVILFHLDFLPNGYLGVDIFFVISGYLITSIVYNEAEKGKFSILKFYERRLRRIIPLLLFISTTALLIGLIVMLPDDLENLSQGVFASNFSANNILMYITSADYWAVKNDYKPLMHTWSLGIEEQFYLLYPFLFFFMKGARLKYLKYVLIFLTTASLIAFLYKSNIAAKFYFIQFRFFELSIGGLGAIYFKESTFQTNYKYSLYLSIALIVLILIMPYTKGNDFKIMAITFLTFYTLVIGRLFFNADTAYKNLLSNKVFVFLGKISFSLYMWHQLVFAFSRYTLVNEITTAWAIGLVLLTIGLSIATFFIVENPFRDRQLFSTRKVLVITGVVFLFSSVLSFHVYRIGGIIKDFPELGLYKDKLPEQRNFFSSESNIHIQYNEDVRSLDKKFSEDAKTKILIIGNSFGRDIVNLFLECDLENIELSYFDDNRLLKDSSIANRVINSDYVFYAANGILRKDFINRVEKTHGFTFDRSKLWIFGTKDFGYSNGIHYNNINSKTDFGAYRTNMKKGVLETNEVLKSEWNGKYIDIINLVKDESGKVLVFTPEGKFISQDTVHFTKFGAIFFASILKNRIYKILQT